MCTEEIQQNINHNGISEVKQLVNFSPLSSCVQILFTVHILL